MESSRHILPITASSSTDAYELPAINQLEPTDINSLPDDMIRELLKKSNFACATVNKRFFSLALSLMLSRLRFDTVLSETLSADDDPIEQLKSLAACVKPITLQFEDDRLKLSKLGILMLRMFEIIHFLNEQEIMTFKVIEMVKEFKYVGAAQYQWIDMPKPIPMTDKHLTKMIHDASMYFICLSGGEPITIEHDELIDNIRAFHKNLSETLEQAQKSRLFAHFLSLFKPAARECDADKILRLITFTLEKIDSAIPLMAPIMPHSRTPK